MILTFESFNSKFKFNNSVVSKYRNIAVFENFQEKSLSFRDLMKVMKQDMMSKYQSTILNQFKRAGLNVTNFNADDKSFEINKVPMEFIGDSDLGYDVRFFIGSDRLLRFVQANKHLENFILRNANRSFSSASEVIDFFLSNAVMFNKSSAEVNNAAGVFEKYKHDADGENFRDIRSRMKSEMEKKFCYEVFKRLKKAGFKVEVNHEMFYDFNINTVPMQIVNEYEISFDLEKIFSSQGRFVNGVWKRIDNKKEKLEKSFADKHPELMNALKKFGISSESSLGGPVFRNVDDMIKFFEVNVDFYLNKSVRNVMKTGVFDE